MINEAIIFATKAHEGQKRKGTNLPYILHPLEVANIISTITDDERVIASGILHDTLEDTNTKVEDLKNNFGEFVLSIVSHESEDKMVNMSKEESWKLRKQATIDLLKECKDINVKIVALADKLSNLRGIYRGYIEEGINFFNRFNQKDVNEITWYYSSFLENCIELKDTFAYKEYNDLIDKTFKKGI